MRLRLETPAVLARGDRYILRAYSPPVTIAGGVILDPRPPRTAIRSAAAAARVQALAFDPGGGDRAAADERAAAALVAESGRAGLAVSALTTRVGVDPRNVDARIKALTARGVAIRAGDALVTPAVLSTLKEAIVATLTLHHRKQPLSEGIPREELREQLFARGHVAVFDRALDELVAGGTIAVRDRVALATHRLELTPEEERVRTAIERAFRAAGLKPPEVATIAAAVGAPPPIVDRVLKLLQRQKVLVRLDVLLFHDEALKQLKADVGAMKAAGGGQAHIDVATFKERFGVTRKYAIPLLEYLDRERVTRRVGDARVLL